MKRADSLAPKWTSLARRTAIAASFAQATSVKPSLRQLSFAQHALVVDDLDRLSCAVDVSGASDASLACAAAEADPATSLLARVLYSTRLYLRAVQAAPPARQKTGQPVVCATLEAAFEGLRDDGLALARVPRPLVETLTGAGDKTWATRAVRMLAAAYGADHAALVRAMIAPPFSIEPANLRQALLGHEGSVREVLAASLVRLRGGPAKDAAVAGLRALDAALLNANGSFSIESALAASVAAVADFSPETPQQEQEELLRCAASADRIWELANPAADAATRVRTFVDSVASVQVDDLTLVPCVGGDATFGAIAFEDMPGSPVSLASLALALDCEPAALVGADASSVDVTVNAPLAGAVARYVSIRRRADRRRAWPRPEPPVAFVAPAMTFSASRLNSYVKCPRRFYYEYLCEALEDQGSLHATYGRVMHDALEALHREIRVPNLHKPPLILERLHRELDAAFGRARPDFASQLEYESSRWRARRMAEQYVRWLVAEAARTPVEISGVEVFERRRLGEYDFVGYIDRIDKPVGGGPVTIYDYKTGRIETDARAYLEKVRRGDEAQLALYYAMRRAAGDEVGRIALVSIRDPRDDVWILALDLVPDGESAASEPAAIDGVLRASCSRADLDASLAALLQRCALLTEGGLEHFPVGEDPPCHFCAYASACRERPIEGERAFAR